MLSHSVLGLEWKPQQQTNTLMYLPEGNIARAPDLCCAFGFVHYPALPFMPPPTCHYPQELTVCRTREQSKIESYKRHHKGRRQIPVRQKLSLQTLSPERPRSEPHLSPGAALFFPLFSGLVWFWTIRLLGEWS